MYVVVMDYGYAEKGISEHSTLESALERIGDNVGGEFEALYEVLRDIGLDEVMMLREQSKQRHEAAVAQARAKLTPEELRLLGLA